MVIGRSWWPALASGVGGPLTRFVRRPGRPQGSTHPVHRRFGLVVRFVIATALAVGLAGGVVGWLAASRAREALRSDILNRQLATADIVAAATSKHVLDVEGDVQELAGRPSVHAGIVDNDWLRLEPDLRHWLTAEHGRVDSLYLYDDAGAQRVALVVDGSNARAGGGAGTMTFEVVRRTGQAFLGAPRVSVDTQRPVIAYAVPIRTASGEIRGVLRAALSLPALSTRLLEAQPGLNARMSVDDRRYRVILAHNDPGRILRASSGRNAATERLYAGERGAVENVNSNGQRTLAAFAPVPSTPWGVLIQQPLDDAYAPLAGAEREAAIVTVLAAIVAAFLGGAFAYWAIRPLGRLRAAADAMAGGALDEPLGIGRHDEIGDVGRAFDRMAAQLRARDARVADTLVRLRAVVDAVDDAILVVDDGGSVTGVNPAAARLLGRPTEDLVGASAASLVPTGADGAGDVEEESTVHTAEGAPVPVRVTRRQTEVSGAPQSVVVLQDLRPRRAAERARALEELNRLQREFITIASHELRTPATGVLGFSELLVEQLDAEDPNRSTIELIHGEAVRLAALLDDVLDVSRLDTQRVDLRPAAVDLEAFLGETLAAAEVNAPGHRLRSVIGPDADRVMADPGKLGQILRNLLDNAVKYSPAGGQIVVETHKADDDRLVEIAVTDEGIGIPEEHRNRIFDRFYRVDPSDARTVRGTGLGLYIVRQLVALHGGTIRAEQAPAGGTAIRFTLPAA